MLWFYLSFPHLTWCILWSTWQRHITQMNLSVTTWRNQLLLSCFRKLGGFEVRNTVELTYLCRGHVWVGRFTGPPFGQTGWPFTSNHIWHEAGWAVMSRWLWHISCDHAWPQGGLADSRLTKWPKRLLGAGKEEGNEPERAPSTTGRWWTTRKGWMLKHAFVSPPAGQRPTEADDLVN